MRIEGQQEFFVVVDDEDNFIEYLPEDECHAKGLRHRTVSIVAFNDKGETAMQLRSPDKKLFPDMYTVTASGHVAKRSDSDESETYKEAAEAEWVEEVGVPTPPLTFVKKALIKAPEHPTLTAIYTTKYNGPFKPNPLEVVDVKFFSKQGLQGIAGKLTPNARTILEELKLL